MPGSYVVNESVQRSSSGRAANQNSRRRWCLITTICVFTVATVIVLLAHNSGQGQGARTSDMETRTTTQTYFKSAIRNSPSAKNDPPLLRAFTTTLRSTKEVEDHWTRRKNSDYHKKLNPYAEDFVNESVDSERESTTDGLGDTKENHVNYQRFTKGTESPIAKKIEEKLPSEVKKFVSGVFPTTTDFATASTKSAELEKFTARKENAVAEKSKEKVPIRVEKIFSTQLITNSTSATSTSTVRTIKMLGQTQPPVVELPQKCQKSCETMACRKSVASLLMKVDFDTDPCDDFFKFSCNGLALNEIPKRSTAESFRLQMQRYMKRDARQEPFLEAYKTFYNSCMDFKCDGSTDPVVKYFEVFLIENVEPGIELQLTLFIKNILIHDRVSSRVIPLFEIDLEFQSENETIPVITMPISPPLLQTAHSDDLYVANCKKDSEEFAKTEKSAAKIYDHYEKCLNNYTMYIKVLEKSMRIFDIFHKIPDEFQKEQELLKTLQSIEWDVLDVIKRFSDSEIVAEKDSDGILMTVTELNSECPAIAWHHLFTDRDMLFGKVGKVKVRFYKRFKSLCEFYKSTDFSSLKNIILSMLAHDWYVDFMRPTVISDRAAYCERLSNHLMQDVVSNVFLNHVPLTELREFETISEKIFDQLKQTLIADTEKVAWLTADEKGEIILQVDRLKILTNYSEILKVDLDHPTIRGTYTKEDFVANVVSLKRRSRQIRRTFKKSNNATIFFELFNPLATEIQFIEGKNSIFVPLPLVSMFVNDGKVHLTEQQSYEIYSKLGFLISHALLGRFAPKRLKSIIKTKGNDALNFYEDFSLVDPPVLEFKSAAGVELEKGSMISSTTSRFADDASLRLTWETYQRFSLFNNDLPLFTLNGAIPMTYFLNVAQQFCGEPGDQVHQIAIDSYTKSNLPRQFRVNNMIMNSPVFSKTFDCALGSTMNPVVKSQQFPFIDGSSWR